MNDPLLAVILATSSSRGSHIVFRWPNKPRVFKRYSKVKYYADNYHHGPASRRTKDEVDADELDPVRRKANWDRHDEDDDDDQDDTKSDEFGQSDTPSSSEIDDGSDASVSDEDQARPGRNVETQEATSIARSKTSAGASRSKSKARKPQLSKLDETLQSLRTCEPAAGLQDGGGNSTSNNNAHGNATQPPESDAGGTSNNLSPEEKTRREERAARAYRTYLGYETEFLASILSPRPELAHLKFELVIDDLAFLGHPVCVNPGGQWADPSDEANDDGDGDGGRSTEDQHRGRCSSALRRGSHGEGPSGERLRPGESSRSPSAQKALQSDASSTRSLAPLTQFHLVLVLDRPDPSAALAGMDLSSWLQLFYDHIVFKTTASLFAEQVRADYVSREAETLLALRERCMDDGQSYSAYAAQCLGISSLARCLRDLHKSISTSSDAFLTINDRVEVHLQLPPILQDPSKILKVPDIETELDPNDPIFLSGGGFAGMGKEGGDGDESGDGGGGYDRLMSLGPSELTFEEWTRTTGPYLLPWKSLLLLHDHPDDQNYTQRSPKASEYTASEPDFVGSESLGFEQLTRKFTALFRPRVSEMLNFDEVANVLDWELYDDVYPMVRHLIYYRQARVIDVPRTAHVYNISPLFDFKRLPALTKLWAVAFPDLPSLPAFLSQMSSALRPLNALLPGRHQRQLCLDVLVWLLRRDVVVKLHVRLRLVATEGVKIRAIERRAEQVEKAKRRQEHKQRRQARLGAKQARQALKDERKRELQRQRKMGERQRSEPKQEQRGRSRDRDRSRSADTRQNSHTSDEVVQSATESGDVVPSSSGLSVSRPNTLADSDTVASAATAAAAIMLQQRSETAAKEGKASTSASRHQGQHHHHHHHHHHLHHSHPHPPQAATQSVGSQPSAPILIGSSGPTFQKLKFERRPVLRSRSPSTALSVSVSNAVGMRRPRAETTGSSSSSNAGAGARIDSLSMTPSNSSVGHRSPIRPTTPRGRRVPWHVRDASTASGLSQGSAGRTAARLMSRSPSRARLRVTGFGQDEEIEVDGDRDGEESDNPNIERGASSTDSSAHQSEDDNSNDPDHVHECGPACEADGCAHASSSSSSSSSSGPSSHDSSSSAYLSDLDLANEYGEQGDAARLYSRHVDTSESLIVEPSRATREENEWIATMIEGKPTWLVKKLFRLLPYLNGKHTIDEIEYRVGMKRKEIRVLLTEFREVVVTFMHP